MQHTHITPNKDSTTDQSVATTQIHWWTNGFYWVYRGRNDSIAIASPSLPTSMSDSSRKVENPEHTVQPAGTSSGWRVGLNLSRQLKVLSTFLPPSSPLRYMYTFLVLMHVEVRGQPVEVGFSSSTLWIPEMELRLWGLVARAFSCWAISNSSLFLIRVWLQSPGQLQTGDFPIFTFQMLGVWAFATTPRSQALLLLLLLK